MKKTLEKEQEDMRKRVAVYGCLKESAAVYKTSGRWGGLRVKGQSRFTKENVLERDVKEFLIRKGWKVLRGGWPDYLAFKGDTPVFIEVKSIVDRLSDSQVEMHKALKALGFEVLVVRPEVDVLHKIFM